MYLYARILPNSFTEKYQILISNFVKRYSSYSAIKYLRKFLHREFNGWYYRKVKKIPNSFQKVISKHWWNFLIIPIKKDTVQHPLSLLRNIFHEGIDEINESSKFRNKKKKRRKRFETEIWIATLYTRRKHNRTPMVGTTPGWNVAAIRWSVNSRGIFSRHAAGGGVTNRLCCTLCSIMIYLVKRRTGQRVSIRTVALDCEFRQFAFRPRLSSFSPYTYVYIYRERERERAALEFHDATSIDVIIHVLPALV